MPGQDWQTLAQEILKPEAKPDELVTARASDITKLGAAVTTFVGAVMTSLLGANFALSDDKAESIIAAAVVVSSCVIGVLFVYASDFRTRGRVATARFGAIGRLAQEHIESDVIALQSKLTSSEDAQDAVQAELVEKLVAALVKAGTVDPVPAASVSLEDLVKAIRNGLADEDEEEQT